MTTRRPGAGEPQVELSAKDRHQVELAGVKAQTRERVSRIALMMAQGRWLVSLSPFELATEWGCSVSTIRNYSAMASLLVTGGKTQAAIDEATAATVARLEALSVKAEAVKDYRAAKDAVVEAAKFRGVAYAPTQHRIVLVDATGNTTPKGDNLLRTVPRAALDAAFEHLRSFPGDFEGARARGLEAAHQEAVSVVIEVEASDVSQSEVAPGIIELPDEEPDETEAEAWERGEHEEEAADGATKQG